MLNYFLISIPYILALFLIPFMKKYTGSIVYPVYSIFILICYSMFLYVHVYC